MDVMIIPRNIAGALMGVFLVCSIGGYSQVYSIGNGSWTSPSTWSNGQVPGSASGGVDVVVRHAVTISGTAAFNATIKSLTIENGSSNVDAYVRFNTGDAVRTLTILEGVTVIATEPTIARLIARGENTTVVVGGDIHLVRNHSGTVNQFGLSLEDGCTVSAANLIIDYRDSDDDSQEVYIRQNSRLLLSQDVIATNSGGAEEISIDLIDESYLECQNMFLYLTGQEEASLSRDIELRVYDDAEAVIHQDLYVERTGGRRISVEVGNSGSSTATLTVEGNVTVNHLNGDNASGKTLPVSVIGESKLSVLGDFRANSTSSRSLDIQVTNSATFDVDGNFYLNGSSNNNARFMAQGNCRVFFGGDVVMNYPTTPNANAMTFSNTSTVTFDGVSEQDIPGPESYGTLVVDNPAGATIVGDITVATQLELLQGKVQAPGRRVTIALAATFSGSSTAYLCNAIVRRSLPTGGPYWFHIGSNEKGYSPVVLDNVSAASQFEVTYYPVSPAIAPTPGPYDPYLMDTELRTVSNGEYWLINRLSGGGSANVSLGWNLNSDVNGDALDKLRVTRWNGSHWEYTGTATYVGNETAGTVTADAPFTSFSPFTLASTTLDNVLLPVTLRQFVGREVNGGVLLSWSTAMEVNNAGFLLERSYDGKHFDVVDTIAGSGTNHEGRSYSYTDNPVSSCRVYYRLRQFDYDRQVRSLDIIMVEIGDFAEFLIFPNPLSLTQDEKIAMTVPSCGEESDGWIHIVDIHGRVKWTQYLPPNTQVIELTPLNIGLTSGTYLPVLNLGSSRISQRLIIK